MEIKNAQWFINYRKEQWNCAIDIANQGRYVNCMAEVKSGKREIVIAYSLLTSVNGQIDKHIYLVNLTRKDCVEQIQELNAYGIDSYVGKEIREKHVEIIALIKKAIDNGSNVVLHFDESDYGSGKDQCIAQLLNYTSSIDKVKHVYYSATSEEIIFSSHKVDYVKFVPHESYKGAAYFLDKGLVHQAQSFFRYEKGELVLTEQGIDCCKKLMFSDKNFGVVRLSTKIDKYSYLFNEIKNSYTSKGSVVDSFNQVFEGVDYQILFVNAENGFYWGDKSKFGGDKMTWFNLDPSKKYIIFINQTSTRSTEWALQSKLAFYHSHRNESVKLNTILQSDCRPFGYRECSCDIYTSSPNAFLVACGRMTYEEYVATGERGLAQRISSRAVGGGLRTKSGKRPHGSYDWHVLIEHETPTFKIHDRVYSGRGAKPKNFTIEYQGHHYTQCNRTSTWGDRAETPKASNLCKFLVKEIYSFSDGSEKSFGYIDNPQTNTKLGFNWTDDWNDLMDKYPQIPIARAEGKRVCIIAIEKENIEATIRTNKHSAYEYMQVPEDSFTE
jgi:hypothetical protein